jgi:hypothetical protein
MPKRKAKAKINLGQFNGNIYAKYLDLNKAVLWKDRQLSIPKHVFMGLTAHSTTEMRFIDRGKGEMWIFNTDKVKAAGEWKSVGQEEQFYFPIELAKKVEIEKKVEGQDD